MVGAGLLGLEAACGLRRRGVPVTVLDLGDRPMKAQLDEAPARALSTALNNLGIDLRLGVTVAEVISAYGETVAVMLTDGRVMATDLMLLSCGIRAEIELAAAAGLEVDQGIVDGPLGPSRRRRLRATALRDDRTIGPRVAASRGTRKASDPS